MPDPSKRNRRVPWVAVGIVSALLLFYASAYYGLLHIIYLDTIVPAEGYTGYTPWPRYRFVGERKRLGGEMAHSFFKPMWKVDQILRPGLWKFKRHRRPKGDIRVPL